MDSMVTRERTDFDEERGDSNTLGALVRFLWAGRIWVTAATLVGIAIVVGILSLLYLRIPPVTVYKQAVLFTMTGASPGKYPNGTDFAPTDMRAPAILLRVFEEANLAQYGLKFEDFRSAVIISPTSDLYEQTIERYRNRLSDRGLTFEERKTIEEEFQSVLRGRLADEVTVTVTISERFRLPPEIGLQLASAIPATWADIYINQLGAANVPVADSGTSLIDPGFMDRLDYPIAYDFLESAFDRMSARLRTINVLAGSSNIRDDETGKTLFDLERQVADLRDFRLNRTLAPIVNAGLSRTPELTTIAYRFKLAQIEQSVRTGQRQSQLVSEVLAAAEQPTTPVDTGTISPPPAGFTGIGSIPQFGEAFIDRVVKLSVDSAGVEFREKLLNEKFTYETTALEASNQLETLRGRLAAIESPASSTGVPKSELEELFKSETVEVVEALNQIWGQTNSVLDQMNLRRLNFDKQLYRAMPTLGAIDTSSIVTRPVVIVAAAAAVMLAALIGLAAYILIAAFRRYKSA